MSENSPHSQSAHFYLGKAYLQMRDIPRAQAELESAAALPGRLTGEAKSTLARLRASWPLNRKRSLKPSIRQTKRINLPPLNSDGLGSTHFTCSKPTMASSPSPTDTALSPMSLASIRTKFSLSASRIISSTLPVLTWQECFPGGR